MKNEDRQLTPLQFEQEFGHLNFQMPEGFRLHGEKPYIVAPGDRGILVFAVQSVDGRDSLQVLKVKEYDPSFLERIKTWWWDGVDRYPTE
jgi:hypothetical protein